MTNTTSNEIPNKLLNKVYKQLYPEYPAIVCLTDWCLEVSWEDPEKTHKGVAYVPILSQYAQGIIQVCKQQMNKQ
jgi:hypothetical protein